nr:ATP-binding cassette domain-containing protein [Candidatus Saccharicenans sp.]
MKDIAIQVINFSHFYGQQPSLKNLNLDIYRKEILGIIGPARSGKSTFLTCLNRLNDLVPGS